MSRLTKPAKVKAEAKRPLARKAPEQEAPGIHELEKRLAEALEQQTATAEILKVISSSPTDIQPVLNAVAESAARLCGASDVIIRQVDGDVMRLVAHIGSVPVAPGADPTISRTTFTGRAILERRTIHIHDVLEPHVREKYPDARFLRQPGDFRTMLCAPLLREDTAIGTIVIRRPEVRPFSDNQIKLLETFANQAVIAIENVRLFNETKEALEQQTVTAEILKIISSSPTDTQPVFDAIVKSGVRLFGGLDMQLRLVKGDQTEMVASTISLPGVPIPPPVPLNDERSANSRSILRREVVQVPDVFASDWISESVKRRAEQRGFRALMCAPMLRENNAIGTIIVNRATPGPFTEKQIALLKTFAAQAVIAIENARLFKELQARNAEITESLEQQTATADILRVISSSPTDIQPVLDAVAESAARLCDAVDVVIRRVDGDVTRVAAHIGSVPIRTDEAGGRPLTSRTISTTAIRERRTIHVHDVSDPHVREEYPDSQFAFRTTLTTPLLREDTAIGAIMIRRPEVRPFTDKQIKLLETFAAQAVIAIENVRLFNETKEALEQQTATADILRVISSSPTDIQPVLDAVAESAARLCGASDAIIRRVDGDVVRLVAHHGAVPVHPDGHVRPLASQTVTSCAIRERRTIHVHDMSEPRVLEEYPDVPILGRAWSGTLLVVPLLREDTAIGIIGIRRPEVRPFSDKQIKLLETFAAQAVIAIENVRLFNETKEALEQQTATAEILKVISSSPTDIQPVFDAILENATRLCGAHMGILGLYEGETYHRVAQRGASAEFARWIAEEGQKYPPDPHGVITQMIAERRPIHILDRRESRAYRERNPSTVALVELGGARSFLAVPMLKEGRVVGGIVIYRPEVRPFTQKQIDLVSTFANQAVIAIENVRLFNETKEALEQQTATADILRVISSSPTDIQPVLDAVAESAARLCDASDVVIRRADGESMRLVAHVGSIPVTPSPGLEVSRKTFMGHAIRERRTIHIHDILEPRVREEYPESLFLYREDPGYRTALVVPLLREDTAIGVIIIRRPVVRPFSDKQIKLLETFAAQAVIAIENVRLFKELQARNSEITESLEQQTATADILRVISSSPTDIQPVLDAVAESAARLCGAHDVVIRLVEGNVHRTVAHHGPIPVTPPRVLTRAAIAGRAILDARTVHIPDVAEAHVREEYPETVMFAAGHRSFLAVPLMREDTAIGLIIMRRLEVRPFSDKQIKLLETFAAQAVIAIENVRLFNETKEALEQQTATAEILRVISSSPTDVQPVLDAVAENATRVCDAGDAAVLLIDGGAIRLTAHYGTIVAVPRDEAIPINRGTVAGRAILERAPVHVPDLLAAGDDFPEGRVLGARFGNRTTLATPLLREGTPIGALLIRRTDVRPFTDKQIALLQTFASQAVIAIENVRLFKEINEALEQQTATSEVLKVISRSTFDLQPVLQTLMDNAARLCRAKRGVMFRQEGDAYIAAVTFNVTPELREYLQSHSIAPGHGTVTGRVLLERRPVHVPDVQADPDYEWGDAAQLGHFHTVLGVPLLREGVPIGVVALLRDAVEPFTDKEIDLVVTFADQAVIAIENVRLFKELQARNAEVTEALEQQTATSEVLKVISRSTFDLGPVLETLVENARKLCGADRATISRADKDGNYVSVIERALEPRPELVAHIQRHPLRPDRGTAVGRAVLERRPVHIPDVLADPEYNRLDLADMGSFRTVLAVPMLREGEPIGVFVLTRTKEVKPFTEKQVEVVTTFADQAVIAIENVRLFQEIQDKSRQLEVASRHKSQFLANMSHELRTPLNAILGYTELVLDGIYGDVSAKVHDVMGRVDKSGRHLLGLINDVLDLSKIEAGQLTLSLVDYSLTDVVQTVFTAVESLAAEKKLALKVALASDLPRGRGDDRRLTQVLLNLVGNAIKFTEAGEVRLEARRSDGTFVVSVADTGPGISEADQQRIFEEFQQVDDSATRKKGGTGLGLSIARRIIELHGGRIQVESAPGRGSTFTVTLPVRVERQASPL